MYGLPTKTAKMSIRTDEKTGHHVYYVNYKNNTIIATF